MRADSIYLDEPFTNALIARAYDEQFVDSYVPGDPDSDDYEREFKSEHLFAQKTRNTAYQELVLRENVKLPETFDNFDASPLTRYDGVELVEPLRKNAISASADEFLDTGLTIPATQYLWSKGYEITPKELESAIDNGLFEIYEVLNKENREFDSLTTLLRIESDLPEEAVEKIKKISDARGRVESVLFNLVTDLIHVQELYERSQRLDVPVLWDSNAGIEERFFESPTARTDLDRSVTAIYFEELNTVSVKSVEQALELRDRPEIEQFRKEVFGAIKDIRKNDTTKEEIKRAVRNANKSVDKLEVAKKTGEILTLTPALYAGDPVVSASASGVGIAVWTASVVLDKKYDWAFTSR